MTSSYDARNQPTPQAVAALAMLAALKAIVRHGYGLRDEAAAERAIALAEAAGIKKER